MHNRFSKARIAEAPDWQLLLRLFSQGWLNKFGHTHELCVPQEQISSVITGALKH